jgi:hypothetical protein
MSVQTDVQPVFASPLAHRRPQRRQWRDYSLDVEELLRDGLGLQHVSREGRENLTARCPFCDDGSSHLAISTEKRGYPCQCWRCGWKGNAVTLVKEALGCSASAALQVLNRYGANFSLRPRHRPRSRNNWRGSGRKSDLQYRRLIQRRCINRNLADGPKKRSELVTALEQDTGLKKSSAYDLITKLIKNKHLKQVSNLVSLSSDPGLTISFPSNSNRKRNGNLIQSESDLGSVTWSEDGQPTITYKQPCQHCGKPVRGKKSKRSCSDSCRQKAFRVKQPKTRRDWDERSSALENINRMFSEDLRKATETEQANRTSRREREKAWRERRNREWSRYASGEIDAAEYCRRAPLSS